MFWNRKKDTNEELQGLIRTIVKEELKESVDEIITMLNSRMEKLHDKEILFIQDNLKNSTNSIIESFSEEIVGLSPQVDGEDALDKSQEESDHSADSIKCKGRKNTTGIYRVSYTKSDHLWVYRDQTFKGITLTNVDLRKLEKKVKEQGLPWIIIDSLSSKGSYKKSDDYIKQKKHTNNSLRYNKEEDIYLFPVTYKKYPTIILDHGQFKLGKNGRGHETSLLLKIFYNTNREVLVRDYHVLKKIQSNSTMHLQAFFNVVYGFNQDMRKGTGSFLKAIFEIFEQDYEVPFFIDFSEKNSTIYINGKFTGISTKELKDFVDELNGSLHPKCDIVRIMHDNQKIAQKYLFYCLMNYGNPKLLELL